MAVALLLGNGMALKEIPLISMSAAEGADEIVVGPRFTPQVFQYRITRTRESRRYPPWASDREIDSKMEQGVTCADYLKQTKVRLRGEFGDITEIPLEPVPLEQIWPPDGTKLRTDSPGIQRNRVSSCCDSRTCLNRCLVFPGGETWYLEINAPSWGVYIVTDGYRQEDVAFGLSTLIPQTTIISKDPGVWPVMRIPCLYCPITNCITNCSNGEYATDYTDVSVSACLFMCKRTGTDPASVWNPGEPNRVQALRPWDVEHLPGKAELPLVHPARSGQDARGGHSHLPWGSR